MSATDPGRLGRFFGGGDDLLPLWIAEPYVDLAPGVVEAITNRAAAGWYGYEARQDSQVGSWRDWMSDRHGWDSTGLDVSVIPSVGAGITSVIETVSKPGDGVILQPPVFTDFKPLVRRLDRRPVTNPLELTSDGYRMDLEGFEALAADPANRVMILCNPHNPVGRSWTPGELRAVGETCAANDVVVVADEIHGDLALPPHRFSPFATVADAAGVRWAATHGPIKTFALAGMCESLLVSSDEELTAGVRHAAGSWQMNRVGVVGVAAFEAAYRTGGEWLDDLLALTAGNVGRLEAGLPEPLGLVRPEATYLAWVDFRGLGLDVPALQTWLTESARLALSPGHWFGRQGAGFARMSIAVAPEILDEAIARLTAAVA
jgi:cystathionine beta-lyase